jgi:hypothetical protein
MISFNNQIKLLLIMVFVHGLAIVSPIHLGHFPLSHSVPSNPFSEGFDAAETSEPDEDSRESSPSRLKQRREGRYGPKCLQTKVITSRSFTNESPPGYHLYTPNIRRAKLAHLRASSLAIIFAQAPLLI